MSGNSRSSGFRRLLDGFFLARGISEESVSQALSVEVLAHLLEEHVAQLDQTQQANAEGVVGEIFTFIRALPEPVQLIAFGMLSEVIRVSRLPEPLKSVLTAAFRAVPPGLVLNAQAGATPEEVAAAQALARVQMAALMPGITEAVQRMLSGTDPIPTESTELATTNTNNGATPPPEETTMSNPLDPNDPNLAGPPPGGTGGNPPPGNGGGGGGGNNPPPENEDDRRRRYLDLIVDEVLPLRQNDTLSLPGNQLEFRAGVNAMQANMDGRNAALRTQARDAFALLPEMTREQRDALEVPLAVLRRVRGPRAERPTPTERRNATRLVNEAINRSAAWDTAIRALATQSAWFPRRTAWWILDRFDDAINDDFRDLARNVVTVFNIITSAILLGLWFPYSYTDSWLDRIWVGVTGGILIANIIALVERNFWRVWDPIVAWLEMRDANGRLIRRDEKGVVIMQLGPDGKPTTVPDATPGNGRAVAFSLITVGVFFPYVYCLIVGLTGLDAIFAPDGHTLFNALSEDLLTLHAYNMDKAMIVGWLLSFGVIPYDNIFVRAWGPKQTPEIFTRIAEAGEPIEKVDEKHQKDVHRVVEAYRNLRVWYYLGATGYIRPHLITIRTAISGLGVVVQILHLALGMAQPFAAAVIAAVWWTFVNIDFGIRFGGWFSWKPREKFNQSISTFLLYGLAGPPALILAAGFFFLPVKGHEVVVAMQNSGSNFVAVHAPAAPPVKTAFVQEAALVLEDTCTCDSCRQLEADSKGYCSRNPDDIDCQCDE